MGNIMNELNKIRIDKGLTIAEIAKKCGLSEQVVSRVLGLRANYQHNPRSTTISKVSIAVKRLPRKKKPLRVMQRVSDETKYAAVRDVILQGLPAKESAQKHNIDPSYLSRILHGERNPEIVTTVFQEREKQKEQFRKTP
jgi:transcriptional regulator with XRE-family HTH domain